MKLVVRRLLYKIHSFFHATNLTKVRHVNKTSIKSCHADENWANDDILAKLCNWTLPCMFISTFL